jgi:hypothetical protein
MAYCSFGALLGAATVILYGVVVSPARESVAVAVQTASGVLTGLFAVFTTIVVTYLGASVSERIWGKREE